METEEWRPVPGAIGYEVSNFGRVRSVPRYSAPKGRWYGGNMLKTSIGNRGYPVFRYSAFGGVHGWILIHRAVLLAFVGPCPDGCEALHRDGDRKNNLLENLRWGTRQENVHDMHRMRTHPNMKLTDEQVEAIRADRRPHSTVAKEFGVDRSLIGKIKNGNCRTVNYSTQGDR